MKQIIVAALMIGFLLSSGIIFSLVIVYSLLEEGRSECISQEYRSHGHVLTEEAKAQNRKYLDEVREVK